MSTERALFAESAAYDRFMGRWSRCLAPGMVQFASVKERDLVLDLGSGIGALALSIAEAIPTVRVVGLDRSIAYVRHAQARMPGDRVRFLVADAQAIPLAAATVDKTLSLLVINFVPDAAQAVREMITVTKAGGVVTAAVWDYGRGMEMLRVFWDEAVSLDQAIAARDERNMPLCRQGELAALWRATGLEQVEEQSITIELSFSSFDDYWRPFLGGQGPAGAYAVSLSEAQRSVLEARLRQRLVGSQRDRPFTLSARAWAVKGIVPGRKAGVERSRDTEARNRPSEGPPLVESASGNRSAEEPER